MIGFWLRNLADLASSAMREGIDHLGRYKMDKERAGGVLLALLMFILLGVGVALAEAPLAPDVFTWVNMIGAALWLGGLPGGVGGAAQGLAGRISALGFPEPGVCGYVSVFPGQLLHAGTVALRGPVIWPGIMGLAGIHPAGGDCAAGAGVQPPAVGKPGAVVSYRLGRLDRAVLCSVWADAFCRVRLNG